jgi:hypothetical protein
MSFRSRRMIDYKVDGTEGAKISTLLPFLERLDTRGRDSSSSKMPMVETSQKRSTRTGLDTSEM